MSKPIMNLPMDTKNHSCGCGGPDTHVKTPCPKCGEIGLRVKAPTVQYHLHEFYQKEVTDRIYGLCLSQDCDVAWYAQNGDHYFDVEQTGTPIWTKRNADPEYACYCNKITRDMVKHAVDVKGLRTMEDIVALHGGEIQKGCAANNPSGQSCRPHFEKMIAEELKEYLTCNKCG